MFACLYKVTERHIFSTQEQEKKNKEIIQRLTPSFTPTKLHISSTSNFSFQTPQNQTNQQNPMSLLLDSTSPSPPSNDSNHGLLSLDQHKPVPAPFLTKTYQLVDDTSTDHIVSWGDDSSTFVVWRPPEFARDLLPNYFKHNNFSSFVRQLNTYGFRKIVPERWEFANEFFRKGEKHLLCEIHRRKTCCSSSSSSSSSCSPPVTHYPFHFPFQNYPYQKSSSNSLGFNPNAGCFSSDDQMLPNWVNTSSSNPKYMTHNNAIPLSSSASVLIEDNERLRRSNSMLVSELSHMKKLYNDIIYFVQNHVRPVAPSNAYPSSLPLTTSGFSTGGGGNLFQRTGNGDKYNKKQDGVIVGCLNSGSTTSSSSLTIVEEEDDDGKDEPLKKTETKLFGVQVQLGLSSSSSFCNHKKRSFEYPTSSSPPPPPSAKEPRFVLSNEDLGFNLMPKSCLA